MYMLKKKANLNLASLREYEMEAYVLSKWSDFFLILNKDIKFALNVYNCIKYAKIVNDYLR